MGAPSREQIDECIADWLARRLSERQILKDLLTLERMTDEELAAIGVFSPADKGHKPVEADEPDFPRSGATR